MSTVNKSTFNSLYNNASGGYFPINTTQEISSADVRKQSEDIKDSVLFLNDDAYKKYTVTASGTDTYSATLSPSIAAYTIGDVYYILFTNANTTAATLNLNTIGAVAIKKNGVAALDAGDISAGQILSLCYDGTYLQIIGHNSIASASETTVGIAEIATQAETNTGTDDARIVTPLKLYEKLVSGSVLSVTVPMTSSEFLNSNSSPVQLLAAPGTNKYYHVLAITVYYDYGTVAYNQGGRGFIFTFGIDPVSATEIAGLESGGVDRIIRVFLREHNADTYSFASNVINKPILFLHGGSNPTTGDGTFKITIEYKLIDVS